MCAHRLALLLCVAPLAALAAPTLDEPLTRVPLKPGSFRVVETVATASTSGGFVRVGPGGHSLVIESDVALDVLTHDAKKGAYVLDRHLASSATPVRMEGKIVDGSLVLTAKGSRLTWVSENDGVTIREESEGRAKKPTVFSLRRWTRTHDTTVSGRATGIGGVFFKANDSKKLREWYKDHLGLVLGPEGWWIDIQWRELDEPARVGHTVWGTFKKTTTHFDGPFMINYRVDRLDALLAKLKEKGVTPERTEDEPGNGRFAWIRDGEGNLVELWEAPPDR